MVFDQDPCAFPTGLGCKHVVLKPSEATLWQNFDQPESDCTASKGLLNAQACSDQEACLCRSASLGLFLWSCSRLLRTAFQQILDTTLDSC